MPPQQFNEQDIQPQAPPPRYGPTPSQPIIPVVQQNDSPPPQTKKSKVWVLVIVALAVAALGVLAYFLLPKMLSPAKVEPTAQAVQEYSPSVISFVKGSENWQNGKFELEGGNGLPTVTGTFIKTTSGQFYTVANVNQQAVDQGVTELDQINPDHAPIYTGNEYQLGALGLVNQVGYGLDKNVIDFLEELLATFGNPTDAPEFAACQADLGNYYTKTGDYLGGLTPNYVYNEKYQSYQWSLDTTELFNSLSVKAQSQACYDFLDKLLSSNVESSALAGTQLIFQTTEETADGATFKLFVAPPVPSEEYEFIFKMKLTGVNLTPTPTAYTSDPESVFSRTSTFALTISQCETLPVIAMVAGGSPVFVSPQSADYKGPSIRDLGYYCTADEAAADGYKPAS